MPLEIQHLTHTYGKTRALSDFSWQFHAGFYGVLGPNGAGKTTLMRLISDNIRRQNGRILFQGRDIVDLGRSFREKLGYMPQEQGLYLDMTGFDFLRYIAVLKRIDRQAVRPQIEQALQAVDCADQAFTRLSACSGGMRQRMMLAQALLGLPQILLLDEPTAGLDPYERVRVRQHIREISRQCIVIWSTHIVSDLEAGADQVLFLRSGSLVDAGPTADLLLRHGAGTLEEAYLKAIARDPQDVRD